MRANKAKTEVRQDQIARAAVKLLARRGWTRLSVAAIAKEVGVVPSALYRHFAGKAEVLDAVLDLVGSRFQENVRSAREASSHPLTQLRLALERHVDLILSGIPVPRIILSEDVFSGNPRHRQQVQKIYAEYLEAIGGFFREAQDQALIRSDFTPSTLALLWLGLVQSPAIVWLLGKSRFDLREHCARGWQLFAQSVQATAFVQQP